MGQLQLGFGCCLSFRCRRRLTSNQFGFEGQLQRLALLALLLLIGGMIDLLYQVVNRKTRHFLNRLRDGRQTGQI